MGADKVERKLPPLLRAVKRRGRSASVWLCDPMHGNTISTAQKLKTRRFDAILSEVRDFFAMPCGRGHRSPAACMWR